METINRYSAYRHFHGFTSELINTVGAFGVRYEESSVQFSCQIQVGPIEKRLGRYQIDVACTPYGTYRLVLWSHTPGTKENNWNERTTMIAMCRGITRQNLVAEITRICGY